MDETFTTEILSFVKYLGKLTKHIYMLIPYIQQADLEDYKHAIGDSAPKELPKKRRKLNAPFNYKVAVAKYGGLYWTYIYFCRQRF